MFTSGGVLLALEIIASRVLAPYFGNSIYVWGSLIGVFLTALSLGYATGGRSPTGIPRRACSWGSCSSPASSPSQSVAMSAIIETARRLGGPIIAKVNVEGSECEVVLGTDISVWRQVDTILLEIHAFAACNYEQLAGHCSGWIFRARTPTQERDFQRRIRVDKGPLIQAAVSPRDMVEGASAKGNLYLAGVAAILRGLPMGVHLVRAASGITSSLRICSTPSRKVWWGVRPWVW
ncbi:MAG: fused MFS/spermidine synthase [bacterium]